MGLSDKDKSEARDALALALELNEAEMMIEGLRRLCARRLDSAHMSASERDRWQAAVDALSSVAAELEAANAPQERDNGAQAAQAAP
jgi:Asp-tRNA(Asn)/Glu-tRNA(Gln) amidotransferase A subunit family amidase